MKYSVKLHPARRQALLGAGLAFRCTLTEANRKDFKDLDITSRYNFVLKDSLA